MAYYQETWTGRTFFDGMNETYDKSVAFGENVGGKVGMRGIGKVIGSLVSPYAMPAGGFDCMLQGNYRFSCPCGWEGSTDNEDLDKSEEYEQYCNERKYVSRIRDDWSKAGRDFDYEQIVDNIANHIVQVSDPILRSSLYDYQALSYYKQNRYPEALNSINESLNIIDRYECHAIKGMILGEKGDSADNRLDALLEYCRYRENIDDTNDSCYFPREIYERYFEECYSKLEGNFCSITPKKRRYITFVDNTAISRGNVISLRLKNVPSELMFPEGEPSIGVLYVSNPVKPNIYYPSYNAEICIFRDQVEELMTVLGCLGAKRVSFSEMRASDNEFDSTRDRNAKAAGKYANSKLEGHYDFHDEDNLYRSLCYTLEHGRSYERGDFKPQEPKGLNWYPRMKEWQALAHDRLVYKVLTDHKCISSSLESAISKGMKNAVEADFNTVVASADIAVDVKKQQLFKESANLRWEYDVEFYPMSEYETEMSIPDNQKSSDLIKKVNWPIIIIFTVIAALVMALITIVL